MVELMNQIQSTIPDIAVRGVFGTQSNTVFIMESFCEMRSIVDVWLGSENTSDSIVFKEKAVIS